MKRIYFLAKTSALLFSLLYVTSCKDMQQDEAPVAPVQEAALGQSTAEEAYPGLTGTEKQGILFGQPISYQEINNEAVFQGDIILSAGQLNAGSGSENARTESAGVSSAPLRWPGGIIYYAVAERFFTISQPLQDAMKLIEAKTPIRFKQRNAEQNFVTFKSSLGSSSSVGMVGGQQFINLRSGFTMGEALHEICHTIGLLHEHTRSDRNIWVKVLYENMSLGSYANFTKYEDDGIAGFDFSNMDFGSIMMFDSYAFSNNRKPTMTMKEGQIFTNQRDHLSNSDIDCISSMYSNLYVMTFDKLYAVSTTNAQKANIYGGWSNMEGGITSDKDYIYYVRNGYLWKSSKVNGKTKHITTYSNTKAITIYKNNLYVLKDGYLVKVNIETGASTKLGAPNWANATAMTYCFGMLYIVSGNNLFVLNPDTGNAFVLGNANYSGVKQMIPMNDKLYFLKNDMLYAANPTTGSYLPVGNKTWSYGVLGSAGNFLYIAQYGNLYRVGQTGNTELWSSNWGEVYHITGTVY